MPDATGTHSDGAFPFGSQVAGITPKAGGNAVNYVFEQITINLPMTTVESKNEHGVVTRDFSVEQPRTGTATLQLETLTTKPPGHYDTFSLFPHGANTANSSEAYAFKVMEVGIPSDQNGERKVTIGIKQKLT